MSMDFGRPSLEREVQWTFVFTAPVAEPTVMSFTVPLNGYTIVATATVVTSYSSSADCPDSAALCAAGVFASRCRVVVGFFSPGGAFDSVWDSVKPMTGKYFFNYFQYHSLGVYAC